MFFDSAYYVIYFKWFVSTQKILVLILKAYSQVLYCICIQVAYTPSESIGSNHTRTSYGCEVISEADVSTHILMDFCKMKWRLLYQRKPLPLSNPLFLLAVLHLFQALNSAPKWANGFQTGGEGIKHFQEAHISLHHEHSPRVSFCQSCWKLNNVHVAWQRSGRL